MSSTKNIYVQKWGNSLAVRIPATIAHKAHISLGSKVVMSLVDEHITLKPIDSNTLTLEQRLAQFNPIIHGTEIMTTAILGKEKFE